MYSWDDDMSGWVNPAGYRYRDANQARRRADAAIAGARTYQRRREPDMGLVSPKAERQTDSQNPLIIAVDVTASMAQWPYEIFDRLPLLYNTLSQYRPDLEIAFAAIGDVRAFDYPLQASAFGRGAELEAVLNAIYPEGADKGSIDNPESYGAFAYWANTRVTVPDTAEAPFVIAFGDITMHTSHTPAEIATVFGDEVQSDIDCIAQWRHLGERWNTWFLRSPRSWEPEATDAQWAEAVGRQRIVHIQDEQRAVDYAIGLVARAWGEFDDFRQNMGARQKPGKIEELERQLDGIDG